MSKLRSLSLGSITLAFAVATACGGDDSSGGGGSSPTPGQLLCQSIASYVTTCGSATACDKAMVADCASVVDLLSAPYLTAVRTCIEAGGSPAGCMASSFSGLTPSAAQTSFASTFCNECAGGVIPGCEGVFFDSNSSVPDELKVAGALILPMSDSLVSELENECAKANPLTCTAQFSSCFPQVIAGGAVPTETASCLVDSLLNGDTGGGGCADAGSGGAAGSGGSTGSGGGTGATGGTGASGGFGGSGGLGGSGGSTGGTGGSTGGTGGSTGGTGGTGGTTCDASYEPNETQSTAKGLGTVGDCASDATLSAALDGSGDVDFYTFNGTDGVCIVNPAVSTTDNVELCMYADCPGLTLSCKQGSPSSLSSLQGCCVSSGGTVELSIDCTGISDDATVYMQVNGASGGQCTPYSITYHY